MPLEPIPAAEGLIPDVQKLDRAVDQCLSHLRAHLQELHPVEVGTVTSVSRGVVRLLGLPGVSSEELVRFPGDSFGMVFNLDRDEIGVILLDEARELHAGADARRTRRILDVPVGEELLGRVVDPIGRPLDDRGPVPAQKRVPCEREARPIMQRAPVTVPLQTGLKVIDALIPIGRGQRELILGDRQTGKTAIALDTIVNQQSHDVVCIYCSIGQQNSANARIIRQLHDRGAFAYSLAVVAGADSPPGLQFIAPFAATTIGEWFMEQGRDVLIVYDDLTTHARAYRELSLLLHRPPGREAFPGDIFYLHSRLLERATHLRDEFGGGSLTALPIAATEAQNVSAYIPTNLISITDGQVYLSPELFQKGVLPAVDVGRSVSRVGGKTQLPAYRSVSGSLRLAYSQFEELETFSRFSSRLDEETRQALERGRRVREVLKQVQWQTLPVPEQLVSLIGVSSGLFDSVPTTAIADVERAAQEAVRRDWPGLCEAMAAGTRMSDGDRQAIEDTVRQTVAQVAMVRPEDRNR
ncbi:MAG: alternate F1F0 ATPase, F1 subunit alpha [Planctomycetota bacterium]|jgi:F-type H+-transporting ATPase subunit alpha